MVLIEIVHRNITVDRNTLKRIGENVLQDQEIDSWIVSVTFADDSYTKKLNKTYLGRDYPTDVLAFPIDELGSPDEDHQKILGDVYVSLDRALEQSEEYGVSLQEEVARLMLHGMLHLLGYTHEEMASQVEKYLSDFKNP